MEAQKIKHATDALTELSQIKKEAAGTIKGSIQDGSATKKLWHEKNKSGLIKIGMALIVFPEPTPISEIIGSGFVAAGLVQNQIKNRSIYMEDIAKDFRKSMKEIYNNRSELRL
jgi:hypothetical protein